MAPHYNHPETPLIHLLSYLFTNTSLHTEIREKGGAYGAGCKHGEGLISFFSFRDPNNFKTLDAYKKAINLILNGEFK